MAIFTSKDGEHCTDGEAKLVQNKRECPDCWKQLISGPQGGMSMNKYCITCGSKFNDMGLFGVDRISNASPLMLEKPQC